MYLKVTKAIIFSILNFNNVDLIIAYYVIMIKSNIVMLTQNTFNRLKKYNVIIIIIEKNILKTLLMRYIHLFKKFQI